MRRMCSIIVEEKYDCNAATIYGNADTIVKKKKVLNCRRMGRWNQLIGQISLACTWNIVYAYVRKVSYFIWVPYSQYVKHCLCVRS